MIRSNKFGLFLIAAIVISGCTPPDKAGSGTGPSSLSDVPAVRLSYRYEADVPPPTVAAKEQDGAINVGIQRDFELNRSAETLDRVFPSPDGKKAAVVYSRPGDQPGDYRLDLYDSGGTLLRKLTSDLMAVHFPDTIRWSPDSRAVAFVAMLRTATAVPENPAERESNSGPVVPVEDADENANRETASNTNEPAPVSTPQPPTGILTFRSDQLYLADSDGGGTRPLTQNESLIYYYYEWSPDSSMLVTLASTVVEWGYRERGAKSRGEVFVPAGRPRVVERNGRERLLDDSLTSVHPVWSPDSKKIACAYNDQVRIYDAGGTVPTQAAIPLRNSLLLSSQAYDREQARSLNAPEGSEAPPANSNQANVSTETLPDPNTLASFNPIVALHWASDELLYFQTAFIKRMLNEADSVSSFPRWHRLVFAPQAADN
ncbi:TolB family protein [Leptolyngbya sp. 7M]|uniref:TolB family protein n=1 Tax=Leptolyngbya sp. 7M TaxID=2812896 RepID=UPI001B8C9E62|nr:hypothetical protein [Leptolyngbya sp. 7M]QYO66782.1 hypothetical protein JVX88_08250 [Leptolyngbya sp. 7M]